MQYCPWVAWIFFICAIIKMVDAALPFLLPLTQATTKLQGNVRIFLLNVYPPPENKMLKNGIPSTNPIYLIPTLQIVLEYPKSCH